MQAVLQCAHVYNILGQNIQIVTIQNYTGNIITMNFKGLFVFLYTDYVTNATVTTSQSRSTDRILTIKWALWKLLYAKHVQKELLGTT